ncbi:Ada metal-binding domain-containing protein [Siphonobacter sp. SORGH_AS_0500]|uniref:Ada metal-binding domain-containing protein n=1 Tax=Siphonobacter sp. SORGH_AS_0500 TaxID=1864824 RepID=UPI00286A2BA0|nr:Ada metal-binding domain-containing protein [Siphonobacter sp. SORGH_AS_0500]
MIRHSDLSPTTLRHIIRRREVVLGGNMKLKIYGSLGCSSGKRMRKENRVFFHSEAEALQHHYRPCGHCLREKYKAWKLDHKR